MAGNMMFPVIFIVFVSSVRLSFAQLQFTFGPPRPSPRSWGLPNEIFGSTGGPAFRPPPGVLIAGNGPPVSRPLGPVRLGGRPPFQLITSTSTRSPLFPLASSTMPPPFQFHPRMTTSTRSPLSPFSTSTPIPTSDWPSHGPQIQRAKESSHFEYEVVPRLSKPPTILRSGPPRLPPRPMPTQMPMPSSLQPNVLQFLAREAFTSSTPRTHRRTDRPPPFMVTNQPRVGPPTYATPSDADFQEGFRILSDLFKEDAGSDIRSNLVGGSDVAFSGGYFPPLIRNNKTGPVAPKPAPSAPVVETVPAVHITPAKEQGILLAGAPQKTEDSSSSSEEEKAPSATKAKVQDQKMQGSDISYGPPDFAPGNLQHESFMYGDPSEPYNLYNPGYDSSGPPPPFHTVGNSILPPPLGPPRQAPPSPSQSQKSAPPKKEYGAPQKDNSGYPGGYNQNGHIPLPLMMMPLSPEALANGPAPSSEEVQRALATLARYASKQAQSYGAPQKTPDNAYGAPQKTPDNGYGAPQGEQQQASTPSNAYGAPPSLDVTAPPASSSYGNSVQESYNTVTKDVADAITISDSDGSSPQPTYGSPQEFGGGSGGYSGGGGGSGGSGGYSGGGGWSSGGGGAMDIVGTKLNALKTIGTVVTGGIQQVGALKAGILNAGLNVLGGLHHAKGNIASSLKVPILPVGKQISKPVYGPPGAKSGGSEEYGPPSSQYGAPGGYGGGQGGWSSGGGGGDDVSGPIGAIVNAAKDIVGGAVNTVAASGKAAVGIGLSKNEFVKNHFVIKGQAFTDTVSKKIANKNEYWQNVLKHITSIFEAARKKPSGGWSRR